MLAPLSSERHRLTSRRRGNRARGFSWDGAKADRPANQNECAFHPANLAQRTRLGAAKRHILCGLKRTRPAWSPTSRKTDGLINPITCEVWTTHSARATPAGRVGRVGMGLHPNPLRAALYVPRDDLLVSG